MAQSTFAVPGEQHQRQRREGQHHGDLQCVAADHVETRRRYRRQQDEADTGLNKAAVGPDQEEGGDEGRPETTIKSW
jgi:hypothetical protein